MDDHNAPMMADPFDTDAVAQAVAESAATLEQPEQRRRGAGGWWLLLLLVIVFGYLSAARRASLGRFAAQMADIVRDFRGYDPEF